MNIQIKKSIKPVKYTNAIKQLEQRLEDVKEDLDVAVIGCYVNGPGESKHVSIGVTGASPRNLIYIDGKPDNKDLNLDNLLLNSPTTFETICIT